MAGAMSNFSWDDLRHFLAVARTGQLSAAARELRTSHVTVVVATKDEKGGN